MIITAVYEVKYCIRASTFFWKNMTTAQTNQRCLILNLGELIPLPQSQQRAARCFRHQALIASGLVATQGASNAEAIQKCLGENIPGGCFLYKT